MKTKEQIKAYNKEYSSRPEVIAWARERNARPERRAVRNAYKRSDRGKEVNKLSRKRNWAKNAPLREKKLLWRYGLTSREYENLLSEQGGACMICATPFGKKRPHIDHSHETGKIRGLLCSSCNLALGLFKDDVLRLGAAIRYLDGKVPTDYGTKENS